ncbi:hypothetical protein ALC57_16705 [Trachymyrmex cornetzi]|uniref:Uncharacterized protein n=1 Tax=Trachymyrmex cornetzi TaxID=471704 RepID=A0A195DE41_9HYME|nr:hypothetical protein ALC57_16705 [Trachymyrmex cornetzi]
MRELVLRVVSVRLYDSLLPPVVPPLRDETFAMRRGSVKLTVILLKYSKQYSFINTTRRGRVVNNEELDPTSTPYSFWYSPLHNAVISMTIIKIFLARKRGLRVQKGLPQRSRQRRQCACSKSLKVFIVHAAAFDHARNDVQPGPKGPEWFSNEHSSNRVLLTTDHFSDATDLTALPFDQLPTTFFIALPFLHRPLIVGGDVATSVTPPWARYREREKEKKNERERERMREKTRAAKETARPRWEDVYTAQQEARSLCPSNRVASRRVASRRITRDIRFIVAATWASKEIVLRFTGSDLAESRNRRRIEPGHSASVIAVIMTE